MGRIRTIKPEFPLSESIGRLSRDARLLFIQLWTFADDSGRARAASRMLASTLYPYDDDAPQLIDGWLDELEHGGRIRRYVVDGSHYLEIINWLEHQKIEKPSKSRLPSFDDGSPTPPRIVDEASATDLGPRTLDQDPEVVVESERARGGIFTEEQSKLSLEFLSAFGISDFKDVPPELYGVLGRSPMWVDAGWTADMVVPIARGIMKNRDPTDIPAIPYFEKAFARAKAKQSKPLPQVVIDNTPETVNVRRTDPDRSLSQRAVSILNGWIEDDADGGSVSGPAPVRLLPQG